MKATKPVVLALSLVTSVTAAFAGDAAKTASAPKPAVQNDNPVIQTERNVELTGSRIKRTVRRSGRITDGPFNVVVIDRATIEHSGAADLKQLLARQGLGR
jgi:outer membrane cobalamin receptor